MAMKRIFLHVPCSDDVQEFTCSFLKNRGLRETCATHCYITNVTPVKELSQLMRLGLLPTDTATSQM